MATKDKRIDTYIAKSADFAKPILIHIRELVNKACPDVEETMKWSFPHFDYKGKMMCHMASFKQHCAFGFWKASLMKDVDKFVGMAKTEVAMGHMGKITSVKDLPSDKIMLSYIKEAMRLNDDNVKLPSKAKVKEEKEVEIPDFFKAALKRDAKAKKQFDAFTPGKRKEYIDWLMEAKTEATREKRLETALEWIAEGKHRHWKYAK